MNKTAQPVEDSGIDIDKLRDWMDAEVAGVDSNSSELELLPILGGGSCELFEIRRGAESGASGAERYVMRRAPVHAVSSTAHDVLREFTIINAMQNSPVRVPRVFAACDDHSVAGADFFLMEHIDGEVIRRRLPEHYAAAPEQQPSIGEELIDALVELHSFDWRDTALATLSNPDKFLDRQVERWLAQYQSYASRELPAIESLAEWLQRHQPSAGDLAVMHGDYKVDNTMYSKTLPPKVLRIVDFEMTTVGDPLIDLAWAMIFWPEEGNLIAIASPDSKGGMDKRFVQSPQALIDRYAEKSGRNLDGFHWYQVFAAWKLAIVLEASYAKFLQGVSKNPNHEFFGFLIDQLLERGQRLAI